MLTLSVIGSGSAGNFLSFLQPCYRQNAEHCWWCFPFRHCCAAIPWSLNVSLCILRHAGWWQPRCWNLGEDHLWTYRWEATPCCKVIIFCHILLIVTVTWQWSAGKLPLKRPPVPARQPYTHLTRSLLWEFWIAWICGLSLNFWELGKGEVVLATREVTRLECTLGEGVPLLILCCFLWRTTKFILSLWKWTFENCQNLFALLSDSWQIP